MRVINPVAVTAAMVTSSTAAEPSGSDPAVWNVATAYTIDQYAYLASTHKVYRCLVANTGASPDVNLTGSAPKWLEWGSTNKYAMFDSAIGTLTSVTSPLTWKIVPGQGINSIALMELTGTSVTVTVKSTAGGTTVYTNTTNLDGTILTDWYMYFFEPYALLTQVVLTDIPSYTACEVTVSLTGTGTVSCGTCVVGTQYYLGEAQYGANVGIINYTRKTVDSYGRTVLARSTYSKRMSVSMLIDSTTFNKVEQLLETSLRDVAAVWVGTDSTTYAPMVVYGYYKDWSMTISYPASTLATLQIEGLS